jgi:hypothetical protein
MKFPETFLHDKVRWIGLSMVAAAGLGCALVMSQYHLQGREAQTRLAALAGSATTGDVFPPVRRVGTAFPFAWTEFGTQTAVPTKWSAVVAAAGVNSASYSPAEFFSISCIVDLS